MNEPHPQTSKLAQLARKTNDPYRKIRTQGSSTSTWPVDDPLPNFVHMAVEGQTLLPGDWVAVPQSCRLGPGVYNEPPDSSEPGEDSDVRACMAGVLRKRETSRAVGGGRRSSGEGGGSTLKMAWVDYSSKRVRKSESTF